MRPLGSTATQPRRLFQRRRSNGPSTEFRCRCRLILPLQSQKHTVRHKNPKSIRALSTNVGTLRTVKMPACVDSSRNVGRPSVAGRRRRTVPTDRERPRTHDAGSRLCVHPNAFITRVGDIDSSNRISHCERGHCPTPDLIAPPPTGAGTYPGVNTDPSDPRCRGRRSCPSHCEAPRRITHAEFVPLGGAPAFPVPPEIGA